MSIRKLTPEQEAAKQLENKSIADYVKEGMTVQEAVAAVKAKRNK